MLDSVRVRMTLWYSCVLALVLIVFSITTYLFLVRTMRQRTDESLVEMAHNFSKSVEAEQLDEDNRTGDKAIIEALREFRFNDYLFFVYDSKGKQIATSDSTSVYTDINVPTKDFDFSNNKPTHSTITFAKEATRAYLTLLESNSDKYTIIILHPLVEQRAIQERIKKIFFFGIPLSLLLATLGGYFLAKKSLAPVVDMSERAASISAANLHERLPVKNERDELGNLARIFNELLERLDASFEQQRRFMADASHELRTPVAIIRGESEVALSKDDRTIQDYRDSLSIAHDESKRLTRIVEDLFTLARADAGQYKLSPTNFYLDEVIGDCVRSSRSLAMQRGLTLGFVASEEMPIRGDEILLRRLALNLLDNAIKYTPHGGTISVKCESKGDFYQVTFNDTGVGISPEESSRIFERFYRIDKARSRSILDNELIIASGAGLGLSIVRWIAEVHGGKIELKHSNENGSSFVFIVPRNFHT